VPDDSSATWLAASDVIPTRRVHFTDHHLSHAATAFLTAPTEKAAILMQQATGGQMKNTGCAYGDKLAYDQLMAYLTGLKAGRK